MMSPFILFALLGTGVWFGLIGRAGPVDAVFGIVVVGTAWLLLGRLVEFPLTPRNGRALPWLRGTGGYLFGHVSREMIRSTIRVFAKVFSPTMKLRPAIVAVQLPGDASAALILLAYGISLTPGQQIVDIDERRNILYVHAMDVADPDDVKREILALYHRYIEEVT